MKKISLMIHTASCDDFLADKGIPSYFEALVENLNRQTFKNFELIYIDTYRDSNNFDSYISKAGFQVKHVAIHPNHRYWFDRSCCYISAAKNTGILYADGALLVTCDDSEFFPDDLLEKYWCYYNCGYFMHSLHKRMKSIDLVNGKIKYPISGDIYVNDHRWGAVTDVKYHNAGSWTFAGTSFSLDAALLLNGFNEKMDGCKSLEDCDFGGRLALAGHQFAMDTTGFLYILDHQSYGLTTSGSDGQISEVKEIKKKEISNFIAVENYGMLRSAVELNDFVANTKPVTPEQLQIIQRETLKYRQFDPLAEENKQNFEIWLNTPSFDLKAERAALRQSSEWKW